jgi:hypothetical protein
MADAPELVFDLIFGRWRSQTLYAGAALGVFDQVSDQPTTAAAVAETINADPAMLYRLMRALGSIGLLIENDEKAFRLTDAGALLREDHPHSLRAIALLEEGPEHYAIWKHLVDMVRDGRQNGFLREFGTMGFDYARVNPGYGLIFNKAMSSMSSLTTDWTVRALAKEPCSDIRDVCAIGGCDGHLGCALLKAYPQFQMTVFDLPQVVNETDHLWAPKLGLAGRCRYLGGDMFAEVPPADGFFMKSILHDWSDEECRQILAVARKAVIGSGRLFVADFIVPGPDQSDFSKLFDIHMMCWGTGRERTTEEYAALMAPTGWRYDATYRVQGAFLSVVAGTAA